MWMYVCVVLFAVLHFADEPRLDGKSLTPRSSRLWHYCRIVQHHTVFMPIVLSCSTALPTEQGLSASPSLSLSCSLFPA